MTTRKTSGLFDTHIQGIPCLIDVTVCDVVKGNVFADSDWDYTGYVDFEFDVYDRKGYPAPWLAKKLTNKDCTRIEREYLDSI